MQFEKKAREIGADVPIMLPSQIKELDDQTTYLYDEFHHSLSIEHLTLLSNAMLHPVFRVGSKGKLVISTAHYSLGFKNFLQERFPGIVILAQKEENQNLLLEQKARFKVHATQDRKKLLAAAKTEIIQLAKLGPIIVFGLSAVKELELEKEKTLNGLYIALINNQNDVHTAELTAINLDRGIVCLAQEYAVGVDIKFKVDAFVVIVSTDPPGQEAFY